jgi:hypothetical protein
MNCPTCNAECVLHTHKDFSGYFCPNCHKSGTIADLSSKPATQMSMYESLGEKFETQFLSDTRGGVEVDYKEGGSKKMPLRVMGVGLRDRKKAIIKTLATFSCS